MSNLGCCIFIPILVNINYATIQLLLPLNQQFLPLQVAGKRNMAYDDLIHALFPSKITIDYSLRYK